LRRGGSRRTDVEKLEENHILGEFEKIVHMVRRGDIGVGSCRTRLPNALRVGVVPTRPVHARILERGEGRHGPECVGKLLVKSWIKVLVQRGNGHQAKVMKGRHRVGDGGDAWEQSQVDDGIENGDG